MHPCYQGSLSLDNQVTPNFGDDKEKEHGCKEGYYFYPEEDRWDWDCKENSTGKGICCWRNWWNTGSDFGSSFY
jgi:hypothetical protein